ncbi:MAG TPA: hypothetical protein VHQ65_16990, partial [Thermoanaerobaculia bacterium]|nr:hypothetical protein [Thermoanaerobaculia bacterium]
RATELALLAEHAAWSLEAEGDSRAAAAARRLALAGVDRTAAASRSDARALANDEPLAVEVGSGS